MLTPIPEVERSTRRVVHHKGEHLVFSREQISRLFWRKIQKAAGGCWEWQAAKSRNGYGVLVLSRRSLYSHRVSYEIHKGQIPAGLHIDHLCQNKSCCNPDHLEAVTSRENTMRSPIAPAALNAVKTHCPHGHEYTPENTVVIKGGRGRSCRTCRRWHERRTEAKRKGLPLPATPDEGSERPYAKKENTR
ncbi:HNH endonuclease signature motif containing protein [Streptomyces chartreusis]|uniref:HNH endonuclease signature motif containing protein n=1 Tax=Streptomyces chartreusis TaxID=1969 RepID=UPI00380319A8